MPSTRSAIILAIILAAIIAIHAPQAMAATGSIPLLTVSDVNESEIGGVADLTLETRAGNGAVYLNSFPLTKIDTQISIRTAQQIACDISGADCASLDFIYTIRSGSSLVSGPSAGAAASILTIAVLENLPIDNSTILTGTINSGGVIGPVAGVHAKVQAAIQSGFTTILIPRWDVAEELNQTTDAVLQGLDPNAHIIRVSNIYDALAVFTSKRLPMIDGNISVPIAYSARMSAIAHQLCDEIPASALSNESPDSLDVPQDQSYGQADLNASLGRNATEIARLRNQTRGAGSLSPSPAEQYRRGQDALRQGDSYSAASYCFSAGVSAKQVKYSNMTPSERTERALVLRALLKTKEADYDSRNIVSLGDLETYMIVKERVVEAADLLKDPNTISAHDLAYADERLESAISWSSFFGAFTAPAAPPTAGLEQTCIAKVNEAEERVNDVYIYFPSLADRTALDKAREYYDQKQYPLCIFSATTAKSNADALLTALYLEQAQVKELVSEKLALAKQVLLKEQQKNVFPILGYSYYEYSNSLDQHEPANALIYAEYSLDLGNLDLYFPHDPNNDPIVQVNATGMRWEPYALAAFVFLLGISIGSLVGWSIAHRQATPASPARRTAARSRRHSR